MTIGAFDSVAARKADFLKHPRDILVQPHLSTDDKWAVVIAQVGPDRTPVLVVPYTGNITPAEGE